MNRCAVYQLPAMPIAVATPIANRRNNSGGARRTARITRSRLVAAGLERCTERSTTRSYAACCTSDIGSKSRGGDQRALVPGAGAQRLDGGVAAPGSTERAPALGADAQHQQIGAGA